MELKPSQLKSEWSSLKLRPVYLLAGDERWPKEKLLEALKKKVGADAFNLHEFDGEGLDAGALLSDAQTPPVFSDRRLIVLKRADRLHAAHRQAIAQYAKDPLETTCLVMLAAGPKPKKTDALAKAVQAGGGALVVFYPKGPEEALEWAGKRLKALGAKLEPDALSAVVEASGGDLEALEQELEKLSLYGRGREGALAEREALEVLAYRHPENPFEIGRSIYLRQPRKALKQIGALLGEGQSEHLLLSQIAGTFNKLLQARRLLESGMGETEALYKVRMYPRYHPKFPQAARRWPERKLVAALWRAVELDAAWKGGADLDRAASLRRLVLESLA